VDGAKTSLVEVIGPSGAAPLVVGVDPGGYYLDTFIHYQRDRLFATLINSSYLMQVHDTRLARA
jgi:hypothetical protein